MSPSRARVDRPRSQRAEHMELNENGEVAVKLKALYERSLKARKKQRAAETKAAAAAAAAAGGPHVDSDEPLKGVLAKGDDYPRRAHDYLKAQDGRGVYRKFDFPHLDEIRDLVKEKAEFPGGPEKNFNPEFKQQFPYEWDAHHILPGETFYSEVDGKPIFSFKALRLILQTDYNLNHGHNQILLPSADWSCPIHTLLCHPSDHPKYTIDVAKDMQRISSDIQSKIDNAQPHDTLKADIFKDLQTLENKWWKWIVALSRVSVPKACLGIKFVDP